MSLLLWGLLPWWMATVVVALTAFAGFMAMSRFLWKASAPSAAGRSKKEDPPAERPPEAAGPEQGLGVARKGADDLAQEPWCPKMETKDWREAGELPGCPWNFDACEELSDALDLIWQEPLSPDLRKAADALRPRVRGIQVCRVSVTMPRAVHHAVIYTLGTGAELFGGAPLDPRRGLGAEAGGEAFGDDGGVGGGPLGGGEGLRQRRGLPPPAKRAGPALEAPQIMLPCLLPFYRVHDGFGVLLSTRHLPLVLGSPAESVNGSCFYVYPARGLEAVGRQGSLVKFARVDRSCSACADRTQPQPSVVYVERGGEQIDDDEPLLSFIGDTVSNVAGKRVVPPSYLGGPSPFSR